MTSSAPLPEELLGILKYLRDNSYIRGIGSIEPKALLAATGLEEPKMRSLLEACVDSQWIEIVFHSEVCLSPGGLKALLLAGR